MLAESGNDHPDENCNDERTDRCGQSRRNSLHADFREDSSKSRCQRGDESINKPRHKFEFATDYTDYADLNPRNPSLKAARYHAYASRAYPIVFHEGKNPEGNTSSHPQS